MNAYRGKRPVTVHIKGKVTGKWREAVKHGGKVLVFSPYVTGPTAWEVLSTGSGRCELYTDLSPLNFASGASSLGTIRRLIDQGVKVYGLDDLHAKLMLVPGRVLTVGSQNLTRQGASGKRLEASAVITDAKIIELAERDVKAWTANAQEVKPDMLEELAKSVRRLKRAMDKLADKADAELKKVIENQRKREADAAEKARIEKEARDKEAKERTRSIPTPPKPHERRDLIRDSLSRLRRQRDYIPCMIKSDGTLRPSSGYDFRFWQDLSDRLKRFVCFDAESMRWGWARVGKGVISRINQGLTASDDKTATYSGQRLSFTIHALPVESPDQPNMSISVKWYDRVICRLQGMLLLDDLVIDNLEVADSVAIGLFNFRSLPNSINANQDGLKDLLLNIITEPFRYDKQLAGDLPREFLGRGWFRAYVGSIRGNPNLVLTRPYQSW